MLRTRFRERMADILRESSSGSDNSARHFRGPDYTLYIQVRLQGNVELEKTRESSCKQEL